MKKRGQEKSNCRGVGDVTGRADVQVKYGRQTQTCQPEILIMVVRKNARKHITSISFTYYSRDKIACPRSMRER